MVPNSTQSVPFYHHSLGFILFSLCLCLTLSKAALHGSFLSVFLMHSLSTQWLHHGDQTPKKWKGEVGVGCGWRRNSLSATHTGLCRTVNGVVLRRKPGNRHTSALDVSVVHLWLYQEVLTDGKMVKYTDKGGQSSMRLGESFNFMNSYQNP